MFQTGARSPLRASAAAAGRRTAPGSGLEPEVQGADLDTFFFVNVHGNEKFPLDPSLEQRIAESNEVVDGLFDLPADYDPQGARAESAIMGRGLSEKALAANASVLKPLIGRAFQQESSTVVVVGDSDVQNHGWLAGSGAVGKEQEEKAAGARDFSGSGSGSSGGAGLRRTCHTSETAVLTDAVGTLLNHIAFSGAAEYPGTSGLSFSCFEFAEDAPGGGVAGVDVTDVISGRSVRVQQRSGSVPVARAGLGSSESAEGVACLDIRTSDEMRTALALVLANRTKFRHVVYRLVLRSKQRIGGDGAGEGVDDGDSSATAIGARRAQTASAASRIRQDRLQRKRTEEMMRSGAAPELVEHHTHIDFVVLSAGPALNTTKVARRLPRLVERRPTLAQLAKMFATCVGTIPSIGISWGTSGLTAVLQPALFGRENDVGTTVSAYTACSVCVNSFAPEQNLAQAGNGIVEFGMMLGDILKKRSGDVTTTLRDTRRSEGAMSSPVASSATDSEAMEAIDTDSSKHAIALLAREKQSKRKIVRQQNDLTHQLQAKMEAMAAEHDARERQMRREIGKLQKREASLKGELQLAADEQMKLQRGLMVVKSALDRAEETTSKQLGAMRAVAQQQNKDWVARLKALEAQYKEQNAAMGDSKLQARGDGDAELQELAELVEQQANRILGFQEQLHLQARQRQHRLLDADQPDSPEDDELDPNSGVDASSRKVAAAIALLDRREEAAANILDSVHGELREVVGDVSRDFVRVSRALQDTEFFRYHRELDPTGARHCPGPIELSEMATAIKNHLREYDEDNAQSSTGSAIPLQRLMELLHDLRAVSRAQSDLLVASLEFERGQAKESDDGRDGAEIWNT